MHFTSLGLCLFISSVRLLLLTACLFECKIGLSEGKDHFLQHAQLCPHKPEESRVREKSIFSLPGPGFRTSALVGAGCGEPTATVVEGASDGALFDLL